MSDMISIEVLYALPHEQTLLKLQVPQGCTVSDAVNISGMREKYPVIDPAKNKLGIFGKLSKTDAVLRDRDRIEIYRPLIADPKEIRRQRVIGQKVIEAKVMTAEGSLRSSGVPTGGVNSAPASAGSGLPTFGVPLAGAKGGGEISA